METDRDIVLITGGTVGGIGFELAVQLLRVHKHVLLGIRSAEKRAVAQQVLESRGHAGAFEILDLDVNSEASITAAAKLVEAQYSKLDALVNNAAATTLQKAADGQSITEKFANCFQTNATGVFLIAEAFVPLLKQSRGTPRIINISSGAGSIRRLLDPTSPRYALHMSMGMSGLAYGASKAAMNLITAKQAVVYGQSGFKVFAYTPGFVVSNASPNNRVENGAQETGVAVEPIVRVLLGERDAEHGCFLSAQGQYEW